jgi:N-acetylglucosaminyl-diphospho-decaprenol L-rhamnosyltransferase
MSPPTALVAVVIVNFNTGDYLRRCLASLSPFHADGSIEVVVIDNASRDGSARAAVVAHPWVRLIENPTNEYLSPAWNRGARETTAPFLLFLNPDTEWWVGSPADLAAVARTHRDTGLVGPMIRDPDGRPYASGRRFPSVVDAVGHAFVSPFTRDNPWTRRYEMKGWDRTTDRVVDWVSGACMLMPRNAYEAVGGFDEAFPLYAEELDIATRLRDAGRTVRFTPTVEVLHEVGVSTGGDRRSHRLVVMHSSSLYRYYAKHRAAGWRRVTLPFAWVALRLRAEIAWLRGRVTNR